MVLRIFFVQLARALGGVHRIKLKQVLNKWNQTYEVQNTIPGLAVETLYPNIWVLGPTG